METTFYKVDIIIGSITQDDPTNILYFKEYPTNQNIIDALRDDLEIARGYLLTIPDIGRPKLEKYIIDCHTSINYIIKFPMIENNDIRYWIRYVNNEPINSEPLISSAGCVRIWPAKLR